MEKQDVKLDFRCTPSFEKWIGEIVMQMPEFKFPDLVRPSVLFVSPILESSPEIVKTFESDPLFIGTQSTRLHFRISPDLHDWLSGRITRLPCSLVDLVRLSLRIALPLFAENFRLVDMVKLRDFRTQGDNCGAPDTQLCVNCPRLQKYSEKSS